MMLQDFTKTGIMICYFFTISLGAAGVTLLFLSSQKTKSKRDGLLLTFLSLSMFFSFLRWMQFSLGATGMNAFSSLRFFFRIVLLILNLVIVIFAYKNAFKPAYESHPSESDLDLDERMEQVATEFSLTARETVLCRLIYEGYSNGQIAEHLFISESTVKTHTYNIFRKLNIKNRGGVTQIIRGETPWNHPDSKAPTEE